MPALDSLFEFNRPQSVAVMQECASILSHFSDLDVRISDLETHQGTQCGRDRFKNVVLQPIASHRAMEREDIYRKRFLIRQLGTQYNAAAISLYIRSFYCRGLTAQLPPAR